MGVGVIVRRLVGWLLVGEVGRIIGTANEYSNLIGFQEAS
jgi:hypothetical protein